MSDQAALQSPEDQMFVLLGGEDEAPVEEENPETPPEEEAPDAEEEPEAGEESEEGESEESEEAPSNETFTIKVDGQELTKSKDEIIALAQQGLDYTQKTQKIAEDRRTLDGFAENLRVQEQALQQQTAMHSALNADIAKVTAIDQQLAQYQALDWQALSQQDPVQAQQLFFAFTQLQTQRGQIASEVQNKHQQYLQAEQVRLQAQAQAGSEVLQRDIPGWNQERASELKKVGVERYGFTDRELSSIVDPRMIKVLNDAAQWQKLQTSAPVSTKKVASAKPVVKPGAQDAKRVANSNVTKLRETAKRTGRVEDAARLIEKML